MRTDRYLNLSKNFVREQRQSRFGLVTVKKLAKVADALELIHERLKEDIVPERFSA